MNKKQSLIIIGLLVIISIIVSVFNPRNKKNEIKNPEDEKETVVSYEPDISSGEEEENIINLIGQDMDLIPMYFDSSKYFIQTNFVRDESKKHEEIIDQEIADYEDYPDMKTVIFTINILEEEFEKEKKEANGKYIPFPFYLGEEYHNAYLKAITFESEYDIKTEFLPYEGKEYNEFYPLETCVKIEYNGISYELKDLENIETNNDGTISYFAPFDEEYGIYKVYVTVE